MNLRYDLLRAAAAIVVAEGDKGAILIADTEDIAACQHMAKWLIASIRMTLIGNAVEGLAPFGMGVNEDELVAFAYNLGMEGRDCWPIDDDGIGGIAPDVDHWLVQRIR